MPAPPRRVIPREELTAWERWELGALNEEAAERERAEEAAREAAAAEQAAQAAEMERQAAAAAAQAEVAAEVQQTAEPEAEAAPAIPLPTAEEIDAIHQQAQREGFEAGLEAGRLAAEDETHRLKAVLETLEGMAARFETELAEQTLDLALVIARQLVRETVTTDRSLLLPLVREALAGLPPVKAPARLVLNPDDLAALEGLLTVELPQEVWRLVPDPQMEAGGCRIDTANTRIELTLAQRWSSLTRVLDRHRRPDLAWQAADGEGVAPPATADEAEPAAEPGDE